MSRLTGPRVKIMRALGVDLPGLSRKSMEARAFPPGQHGNKASRKRRSDFGVKLIEKQKVRFNYGLTETQMRRQIVDARKGKEPTGEHLIQLLERRLDNVVFRAGFAPTIVSARQLVSHGHLLLNGKRVNIPSMRLKIGDEVAVRVNSKNIPIIVETLKEPALDRPEWIVWDDQTRQAKISHYPSIEDVPYPVDLQLVVEFYANRV
ncbi:MAG: 30S ribosomal protein S4 [Methylophilaceae bacterium]